MKSKTTILGNLFQKIALWNTNFDGRSDDLKNHIIMLDWVISKYPFIRDIDIIVTDPHYELTPEEYIVKYDVGSV